MGGAFLRYFNFRAKSDFRNGKLKNRTNKNTPFENFQNYRSCLLFSTATVYNRIAPSILTLTDLIPYASCRADRSDDKINVCQADAHHLHEAGALAHSRCRLLLLSSLLMQAGV